MVKIKAVRLGVLGLILGGSFAYGQNIPSKIETISLSRIREMQTQGALVRTLGGTSFLFSLAFDGHAEPQLVMLPEGKHEMQQSWSLEALRSGVEYIGKERLILKEEKKEIRVYRSSNPKEMLASFMVMELMGRLYDNAFSPKIPIVKYGVVYSESPNDLFPISFATIRRDLNGQYWVGVFSLQEMTAKLNWIVSINGVRYFVKMEGTMVSFYLQEAPAGSPVPKFFSSPLQKPVKFSH